MQQLPVNKKINNDNQPRWKQ